MPVDRCLGERDVGRVARFVDEYLPRAGRWTCSICGRARALSVVGACTRSGCTLSRWPGCDTQLLGVVEKFSRARGRDQRLADVRGRQPNSRHQPHAPERIPSWASPAMTRLAEPNGRSRPACGGRAPPRGRAPRTRPLLPGDRPPIASVGPNPTQKVHEPLKWIIRRLDAVAVRFSRFGGRTPANVRISTSRRRPRRLGRVGPHVHCLVCIEPAIGDTPQAAVAFVVPVPVPARLSNDRPPATGRRVRAARVRETIHRREQRIRSAHPKLGGLSWRSVTTRRAPVCGAGRCRRTCSRTRSTSCRRTRCRAARSLTTATRRPPLPREHRSPCRRGVGRLGHRREDTSRVIEYDVRRLVLPRVEKLYIRGRDQTRLVEGVLKQVAAVAAELATSAQMSPSAERCASLGRSCHGS